VNPDLSPDLSIVIVSWNVCDLLRRCLASTADEVWTAKGEGTPSADRRPPATEIIVVDNASSDGSAAMVRDAFPRVHLIQNNTNLGFTAGNNQGIAAARGRVIFFLNPDAEVQRGALSHLIAFIDAHPDVGIVGPQVLFPDGQIQSSRRRFPTTATLFFESTWLEHLAPRSLLTRYTMRDQPDDAVLDVDWVIGAAMLARREAIDQAGGFDVGYFMYSEELDLCRRVKAAGWRVVYYPLARVIHHEGKSSEQAVPARHINFQRSKIRYAAQYHGRGVAALLRLYLLTLFAWQLGLELGKGLLGHRRTLRWGRARAYWQVLRSRLKP
jgi:N-acetylglucosaminyl-diphospho-decaprenol L-rhamnosyltransferase